MSPDKLGSVVGAGFGLVFVLANTSSVPMIVAVLLRSLAILAFLTVVVSVRGPAQPAGTRASGERVGRGFWLVAAAEALAIEIGLALLNGPLDTPHADVGWISLVVGAHFVVLAVVGEDPVFHRLGAALLPFGLVGVVLAARGTWVGAVDLIGGVAPGGILPCFGLWGSRRAARGQSSRQLP